MLEMPAATVGIKNLMQQIQELIKKVAKGLSTTH